MQITIRRAAQIGGQITRISTARASIIIDLGHNLPKNNENEDAYDNDLAISEITKGCSAILYTHYHGDHIGLFHRVPGNIPQYIGEVARQVVCRKYEELRFLADKHGKLTYRQALDIAFQMHTFRGGQTLRFGDISVTPYFVSHSACDAYMFLIEAEGKCILHTGDFRGHGYLSKGLLPTVQKYIGQVDVLIIEGTMLARKNETILTEAALSQKAYELMKGHKYVFVHCSSTDMERLAAFKNANGRMYPHRPLLADEYQKDILDIFSATAGKKTSCFHFGEIYTYPEKETNLKSWMLKDGFTMFVRANRDFHALLDKLLPLLPAQKKPLLIYSLWEGYIDRSDTRNESYLKLQDRFTDVVRLHTSGHATTDTLRDVCELTNPRLAILPIHKEKEIDFSLTCIPAQLQGKIKTTACRINDIDIVFRD